MLRIHFDDKDRFPKLGKESSLDFENLLSGVQNQLAIAGIDLSAGDKDVYSLVSEMLKGETLLTNLNSPDLLRELGLVIVDVFYRNANGKIYKFREDHQDFLVPGTSFDTYLEKRSVDPRGVVAWSRRRSGNSHSVSEKMPLTSPDPGYHAARGIYEELFSTGMRGNPQKEKDAVMQNLVGMFQLQEPSFSIETRDGFDKMNSYRGDRDRQLKGLPSKTYIHSYTINLSPDNGLPIPEDRFGAPEGLLEYEPEENRVSVGVWDLIYEPLNSITVSASR